MGLTLSRNGFGRRGVSISRIPDTWKMYGGWPSLTHGKTKLRPGLDKDPLGASKQEECVRTFISFLSGPLKV